MDEMGIYNVVDIEGVYGEQLMKLVKLSPAMDEAIRDGRWGVKPSTEKALQTRGIMLDDRHTTLSEFGEHVRIHLLADQVCYVCLAAEADKAETDWEATAVRLREAGISAAVVQYASDRDMSAEDVLANHDDLVEKVRADHVRRAEFLKVPVEATPVTVPEIPGHRWQRHTQPGEAVTEHSTYQAVVADSYCQVSGTVSYQTRTGTWVANGYRNGMSALVSPGSWGGTSLPEALDALVANIAEPATEHASEAAILAAYDAGRTQRFYDLRTHELPGDAERAWDAENAALEGASIDAENEAERIAQEAEDRAAFDADTAAQDELIRQGAEIDQRAESGEASPVVVTEPQPVQVLMDGFTFTLSLASDPHSVVCVGTVLVDRHGEDFTVTGAYLSLGGTRVLRGTYADGGVGVAPYMRFPGLMFRTWPDAPRRIAQDRENTPARVTTAFWTPTQI